MFRVSVKGIVDGTRVELLQFDLEDSPWNIIKRLAMRFLMQGKFEGKSITLVRVFVYEDPSLLTQKIRGIPIEDFKENPSNWMPGWHYDFELS